MKKFAIILSGSGVFDGSEIHEATLSMYAISKNGCNYEIFAPNIEQHHVINHITGDIMNERRNVLIESARIARGKIKDIKELNSSDFDALLIPGGFGVAKNLSDFAFKGAECSVISELENVIKHFHENKKPIGALCIAPAVIAKVLGKIEVTIGNDIGTAKAIEAFGASHKSSNHGEVIIDKENKVYTTPCYMLDATISQIGDGANNIVKAIISSF